LAENDLKPWREKMWCIPQVDAEYVAPMEDVLTSMPKSPCPTPRGSKLTTSYERRHSSRWYRAG
jgi:hypothetical protein